MRVCKASAGPGRKVVLFWPSPGARRPEPAWGLLTWALIQLGPPPQGRSLLYSSRSAAPRGGQEAPGKGSPGSPEAQLPDGCTSTEVQLGPWMAPGGDPAWRAQQCRSHGGGGADTWHRPHPGSGGWGAPLLEGTAPTEPPSPGTCPMRLEVPAHRGPWQPRVSSHRRTLGGSHSTLHTLCPLPGSCSPGRANGASPGGSVTT